MTNTSLSRRQFSLSTLALLGAAAGGGCSMGAAAAPVGAASTTLDFDPTRFRRLAFDVAGQRVAVRAWENLPTVARPQVPAYQVLNLYIPEAYFNGQRVGGHSARSAPIFLPNQVGGYMPARPGTPAGGLMGMGPPPGAAAAQAASAPGGRGGPGGPGQGPSAIAVALARGLVVAAPGARGRTLRAADGTWTGKAPAAIVDLKAAVRWLRHNAARLPAGDTERIISNGTSAGGALSALLGASGNHPAYEPALREAGAADQRDDIFAVSAYCPITDLEHADAAYEWQFQGVADYRRIDVAMLDFQVQRREVAGTLTPAQWALSDGLAPLYPAYVNGLGLRDEAGRVLQLDAAGQGSLLGHVQALVMASAQRALEQGQDLSARGWLRIEAGRVRGLDWPAYVRAMGRMKLPPAFDGVALDSGENQLFGDAHTDRRHFTAYSQAHSQVAGAGRADERTVRMMNAMAMLADPASGVAGRWRIRHGTLDRDTSLAVPALLAAAARQRVGDVDLALPWDRPHSGDYDLDALFDWIDARVRPAT